VERLGAALALWRGPALADVAADGVAAASAARLEELRLAAQERYGEALLAAGAVAEAVAQLQDLVDQHPLREGPLGLLMRALYRSGRQADALAAYRRGRDALVEELGIEPGAQLRDLEGAILRQDPALGGAPAAPTGFRAGDARQDVGTILVAALDPPSVPRLVALAEPLVRGTTATS
jgi:DNA-binding SARP family transcriptional activator